MFEQRRKGAAPVRVLDLWKWKMKSAKEQNVCTPS